LSVIELLLLILSTNRFRTTAASAVLHAHSNHISDKPLEVLQFCCGRKCFFAENVSRETGRKKAKTFPADSRS
jgi:hypothetical protein